jgi:hypothetical protein
MSYYSIDGTFVITLLLQIEPRSAKFIKDEIHELLDHDKEIIIDKEIFNTFGKHDVICFLYTNKLAESIDVIYKLVHSVNGIRDYIKTVGFNWCKLSNIDYLNNDLPPLCFTLIKIDLIKSKLSAIDSTVRVIKEIKRLMNKLNDEVFIEINGTFGWHELSCTFYCKSHKCISDLIEKIRQKVELNIWSTSSIPFAEKNLDEGEQAAILVYSIPGQDDCTRDWLKNHYNYEVYAKFGIYDFIAFPKEGEKFIFENILDFKTNCKSIRDTATFIMTDVLNDNAKSINQSDQEDNIINHVAPSSLQFQRRNDRYYPERKKRDVINLKLLSLETVYKMLLRSSIYSYILPPNLDLMTKWIIENIDNPAIKNDFLRHTRYMLQQRFSGSQVEGLLGIEGGLLEQMGGYQMLVLAAEAIPYMALKNNLKLLSNTFVVFEHDPIFSTPYYNLLEDVGEGPLVIHLPMVKYDPHYWILSLHELGEHRCIKDKTIKDNRKRYGINNTGNKKKLQVSYLKLGKRAFKQFLATIKFNEPDKKTIKKTKRAVLSHIKSWETKFGTIGQKRNFFVEIGKEILADTFACTFISKKTFLKISDQYTESKHRQVEIIIRQAIIDQKSVSKSDLIENYKKILKEGKLISNFSENSKNFFSYVEAYCSLENEEMQTPKCFVSFVLSLYNLRIEFQKKQLKKFMRRD